MIEVRLVRNSINEDRLQFRKQVKYFVYGEDGALIKKDDWTNWIDVPVVYEDELEKEQGE